MSHHATMLAKRLFAFWKSWTLPNPYAIRLILPGATADVHTSSKAAQSGCNIYYKEVCVWRKAYEQSHATVQWFCDGSRMINARAYGKQVG